MSDVVEPAEFPIAEVALHVMDRHSPGARAKRIELRAVRPAQALTLRSDLKFTKEILDNLLSNAIKFSLPDTVVTVRVERRDAWVRIAIEDQGPGLNADDKARVFGRFTKLSARPTGGEKSTGLGLSIVKHMVDALGGKVWVESEPGAGARFILELPGVVPAR